jgi:hypothetical protein
MVAFLHSQSSHRYARYSARDLGADALAVQHRSFYSFALGKQFANKRPSSGECAGVEDFRCFHQFIPTHVHIL